MKTAIVSITAIGVFTFYFAIIIMAMLIEVGMLSYIFFPAMAKRIKEKRTLNKINYQNN